MSSEIPNLEHPVPVVVSGISGRFPSCESLDEFWQHLANGVDMVTDNSERFNPKGFGIPSRMGILQNIDRFDAEFFSVHKKQAEVLDTRTRKLLEVCYESIFDGGVNPTTIHGSHTGVFIGAGDNEGILLWRENFYKQNVYQIWGNNSSMLAGRISFHFGFKGPSYVVDSACSSGSLALHQGLLSIRSGLCPAAIVGSAHFVFDPRACSNIHQLQMTSKDGKCKAFDEMADGYVRSEAVVSLYVCKAQDARRAYAYVVQTASNNDGYKPQGITFPSETQLVEVMRRVYDESGVSPLEVNYIEAHGTGTKAGDREEIAAIAKVFCEGRNGPLLVGSVKSNMGHAESVAGLCGITKVILSNCAGFIPGNLHYQSPNPEIPSLWDGRIKVVDKTQKFNATFIAVNSMGYTGTNVHMLLKMFPRGTDVRLLPPIPIIVCCSGRTQSAVTHLLDIATKNHNRQQFVAILHGIFKTSIPSNKFHGYSVVGINETSTRYGETHERRGVWFIFSGMNATSAGMSGSMLKLKPFNDSIISSADVLLKSQIDLLGVLNNENSITHEDLKHTYVCTTAIHIALVDLLTSVGIIADGIIGHSMGEVAASYADGSATREQCLLLSLLTAQAFLESKPMNSTLARVSLSWNEAQERFAEGIYPAIHNSRSNIEIAGLVSEIASIVEKLNVEGIFAEVNKWAPFGFHSPLIVPAVERLKELLNNMDMVPKLRSSKWISTSIPQIQWDSELAKHYSCDYHINSVLFPVLFYDALVHIPENSVLLEISANRFMQDILRESFADVTIVLGLMDCKSEDSCYLFLESIGACYIAGINSNVGALYESVQFPVPAATPHLSPMVRWDHRITWEIPQYENELKKQDGVRISINTHDDEYKFLRGHAFLNELTFPAAGYIWMAWKAFAHCQGATINEQSVRFENLKFQRLPLLLENKDTEFLLSILPGTGKFEILESGEIACSGFIFNGPQGPFDEMDEISPFDFFLTKKTLYKEMSLRGYSFDEAFMGITEIENDGSWARIEWKKNWVTFIESVLHVHFFWDSNRDVNRPKSVERLTIDPQRLLEHLDRNYGNAKLISSKHQRVLKSVGLEVRGLTLVKHERSNSYEQPAITLVSTQFFTPYMDSAPLKSERACLDQILEIVLDNSIKNAFLCTEIVEDLDSMISPLAVRTFHLYLREYKIQTVNLSSRPLDKAVLEQSESVIVSLDQISSVENDLVFVDNARHISSDIISLVRKDGFLMFKGSSSDTSAFPELMLISKMACNSETKWGTAFHLYRKLSIIDFNIVLISVDAQNYDWIEEAKASLDMKGVDRVYFVSQSSKSGVVGLIKCLIKEFGSDKIRCFQAFEPNVINFEEHSHGLQLQVQKDVVFNLLKGQQWGYFSNQVAEKETETLQKNQITPYIFAHIQVPGDLSSLTWIESPLKVKRCEVTEVHHASLNFKDVMIASGKIVNDFAAGDCKKTAVIGLEFAGINNGKRVMGLRSSNCLATYVETEKSLLLDCPSHWTLEEAATVPIAYATTYIALLSRGRLEKKETILIHAGTGGIGLAAIAISLSMQCTVFTTVSSEEKKSFLTLQFPGLCYESMASSRSADEFQHNVLERTGGRGVDVVLNSLAGDKLLASVRCLSRNGRFIEIGKRDILNNTSIGLNAFRKNITYIPYFMDEDEQIFSSGERINQMKSSLQTDIAAGVVQPLRSTLFNPERLEEAFRFMAKGKHIGKIVVRIRDAFQPTTVPALVRSYFRSDKSYIIVGGLGGMGFELSRFIIEKGGRNVFIVTRSRNTSSYHDYHLQKWRKEGIFIDVTNFDASTYQGALRLYQAAQKVAPVGGIFNTALVTRDALFKNQTSTLFTDVVKCKGNVMLALDAITREFGSDLEYFVSFSSIVSARGQLGLSNYGYANSIMERICELRKEDGLPALAIQWGAVEGVGIYHRESMSSNLCSPQSIDSCWETLDMLLAQDYAVMSSYVPLVSVNKTEPFGKQSIVDAAAHVLGAPSASGMDYEKPLQEYGLDSLMAEELSHILLSQTNQRFSQSELRTMTLSQFQKLEPKQGSKARVQPPKSFQNLAEHLAWRNRTEDIVVKMDSLSRNDETIFIIHPVDGSVLLLEKLVKRLKSNVYGLECKKRASLCGSMEALAELYVEKMKEVQPKGPYKIGGYSFGATVAFEMVANLERRNDVVSLLLLLDGSPNWNNVVPKLHHVPTFSSSRLTDTIMVHTAQLFVSSIPPSIYNDLENADSVEDKCNIIANLLHAEFPGTSRREITELATTFVELATMLNNYSCSTKIRAKTVLIKAIQVGTINFVSSDYGLSEVCMGDLECVCVDGNHLCFFTNPAELGIPEIINGFFE